MLQIDAGEPTYASPEKVAAPATKEEYERAKKVEEDAAGPPDENESSDVLAEGCLEERASAPRRFVHVLFAVVVLAFAALWIVRWELEFVHSCYESSLLCGHASVAILSAGFALLTFLVCQNIVGYFRLRTFSAFKVVAAGTGRAAVPLRREATAMKKQLIAYVRFLVRNRKVRVDLAEEVIGMVKKDVANGAFSLKLSRAMNELLRSIDREVDLLIRREARNVAIGTAISPNAVLDAFISLWRNTRLVTRVARAYGVRAGTYGTFVLIRRSFVSAALADLAQEHVERLLEGVSAVPLGEEQKLARPLHKVGLMLWERQVLFPQELGVAIQDSLKVFTAHGSK